MKAPLRSILVAALAFSGEAVFGQSSNDPNLGYLYPAGGQRGRTIEVLAGGQRLNGVKSAVVAGEGVNVEVIKWYRLVRNVNGDQRKLLTKMLQDRQDVLIGKGKKLTAAKRSSAKAKAKSDPAKKAAPPVKLPAHPLLVDIDKKSLRELEVVRRTFLKANRNQINPQLAELVTLRIKIAPDAKPGDRTIRLVSSNGLTNPVRFQVGGLPEWLEQEPNEPRADAKLKLPPLQPLALPVVMNGQILPGDIDRIKFRAKKGESVVVDARARQLIPYLADAVPGWFQMVVSLLDNEGNELAFADDFRFHPDPLMRFAIPADGVYQLEVRDSIYRGRQDFVYRIRVGKVPVITEIYPLGTQAGKKSKGKVRGWNLPVGEVSFDPGKARNALRTTSLTVGGKGTNTVSYVVDPLPETEEAEPNNTAAEPQLVELPTAVNGRIGRPGDVDIFLFEGQGGQEIVAEVLARRLNSPLDSKLTILGPRNETLGHNDDLMEKDGYLHLGQGLLTHYADSYLRVTLPEDGFYSVVLGDSQGHGSSAYAYRLRLSQPRPRFRAVVTPSALLSNIGGHAPLRFYVIRQDGFTGPVDIELVDAPKGWRLHGARIPASSDHVRATLETPRIKPEGPIPLRFRAVAKRGERTIATKVQAADDRMQAFLWRHLVPADGFLVMPRYKGKAMGMVVQSDGPIRLVPGETAEVRVKTQGGNLPQNVRLVASDPPAGVAVEGVKILSDGFVLKLRTDKSAEAGVTGNLIVEGWTTPKPKPGRKARPYMAGYLPAVPFAVGSN